MSRHSWNPCGKHGGASVRSEHRDGKPRWRNSIGLLRGGANDIGYWWGQPEIGNWYSAEAFVDDVPPVLRLGCLVRHDGDLPRRGFVRLREPDQPCLSNAVIGRHSGAADYRSDCGSVLLGSENSWCAAHRRRRFAVDRGRGFTVWPVLPADPRLHDLVHADFGVGELGVVPADEGSGEAVPVGASAWHNWVDRRRVDHRLVGLGTGAVALDLQDGCSGIPDPGNLQLHASRHATDATRGEVQHAGDAGFGGPRLAEVALVPGVLPVLD